MTLIAYWAENARGLAKALSVMGRELKPLLALALALLGRAFDVFWGLVEAYWDHPVADGTGNRLDQRVTRQRRGSTSNVVAPRLLTTGLQGISHVHLRRGMLANFDSKVKFAARPKPEWSMSARNVVELGPDDEIG